MDGKTALDAAIEAGREDCARALNLEMGDAKASYAKKYTSVLSTTPCYDNSYGRVLVVHVVYDVLHDNDCLGTDTTVCASASKMSSVERTLPNDQTRVRRRRELCFTFSTSVPTISRTLFRLVDDGLVRCSFRKDLTDYRKKMEANLKVQRAQRMVDIPGEQHQVMKADKVESSVLHGILTSIFWISPQ